MKNDEQNNIRAGEEYPRLIKRIAASGLHPERFTLGTLRHAPAVEAFAKKHGRNMKVFEFERSKDGADGRYRLMPEVRIKMYQAIIKEIMRRFPDIPIGICKETDEVRAELGYWPEDNLCNCTL